MTLTNNDPVSPFLSPGTEVAEEEPRIPVDGSVEGMRRLRNPFAVEAAAATGDEPSATDPNRPARSTP